MFEPADGGSPREDTRPGFGFSLLELLIVLAVIAVVAAIAVPVYRDYVGTARDAALVRQIAMLEVFQEDVKLRTGAYGTGVYDPANGVTSLVDAIDWRPSRDDGVAFEVTADGGTTWTATATDATGRRVCRVFPGATPCPTAG
ncbi:MAG: prepilin-type N-terminal cleavage/methylation domain-containing protein [Gammaproteobacteria bacterium]|nr:prepilin-type N-terminal cleavage/methylation domain-containing protein [Gammaproteobacteria bacterium]